MAKAENDSTPPTKFLLPIAFPPLPFIQRIRSPQLSLQIPAQGCQNLQTLLQSALAKCRQTVKIAMAKNPFLQRLIFLSYEYKNLLQRHSKRMGKINPLLSYNFAAVFPGDSVAEMVVTNGISNFLNIYNTLLITRLVLTWFPNSPPVIVNPLSTLCDPYLNVFRGVIPPLGGLDLSPILAFFVLNAVTNVAAALPAELPKGMESAQESTSIPIQSSNLSEKQKLWLKRQCSSSDTQKKDDHNN